MLSANRPNESFHLREDVNRRISTRVSLDALMIGEKLIAARIYNAAVLVHSFKKFLSCLQAATADSPADPPRAKLEGEELQLVDRSEVSSGPARERSWSETGG